MKRSEKTMDKLKFAAVVLTTAVALTMTGCAKPTATVTPAPAETTKSESVPQNTDAVVPGAAPSEGSGFTEDLPTEAGAPMDDIQDDTGDPMANFGDKVTLKSGFEITVGKPQKFTPSSTAADDAKFTKFVKFDVTLKNGTNKRYEPAGSSFSMSSGTSEAEQVFDSEKGLDGMFGSSMRPGSTRKYVIGFGVEDPASLHMEVTLDVGNIADYEHIYFDMGK